MLCTSGFMDDVIFAHNGPYGVTSVPLQRVTSLRRRAQADAPPRHVLDNWHHNEGLGAGRRGRSLQCTTALFSETFLASMPLGSGRSSNRTCVTFDVTNCFSPLTLKCHCFDARRLEKYPDIVAGNLTTAGSRAGLLQSCVCVTIAGQQSIDISWPPGAQQQTRRTLLQRSIDGTDRQTDGHRTVTSDSVPHTMHAVRLIADAVTPLLCGS